MDLPDEQPIKRWTAKRRTTLVMSILRAETSVQVIHVAADGLIDEAVVVEPVTFQLEAHAESAAAMHVLADVAGGINLAGRPAELIEVVALTQSDDQVDALAP